MQKGGGSGREGGRETETSTHGKIMQNQSKESSRRLKRGKVQGECRKRRQREADSKTTDGCHSTILSWEAVTAKALDTGEVSNAEMA
mmetsp:Transcript_13002/g.25469  ORF Transcript_13002/g.25469 Transcript_13002/m.25469 type:complete len:87 (-) Transcript_13002:354-614(-)